VPTTAARRSSSSCRERTSNSPVPAAVSKSLTIENLQLKLPAGAVAIFAQITPEPGDDLRYVSQRLRGMSHVDYLEYSETLADDLFANLMRLAETPKFAAAKAMNATE
jgi:hypothetical protein